MTRYKLLPVLILVVLVLAIAAYTYRLYSNFQNSKVSVEETSRYKESAWISASFDTTNTNWTMGNRYHVEIQFTDLEGVGMPSGASVEILFDPTLLKLNSVTPGDIWDGVTTLEEKINNQEGNAQISYAQALNGSLTTGLKYMTMEFEVIDSSKTETQIQFGEKSEAGWVGQPKLYSIPGMGLTINLN